MDQIQQLISQHINIWTSANSEKKSSRGRSSSNAEKVYGIEKLRDLILNLAIHGNLVPQYTNEEPASELLKRIESEQIKLLKGKKQKPLRSISNEETPFKLPRGWSWVRNSQLFQLRKGKIPKNLNENEKGLPYLDIEALDRNVIRRYSEDNMCPTSKETDILVVCDGSRSGLILNGKCGIIGSTLSIIDTPIFIQPFIKLIFKQGFKDFNTSMKGAAIPHLDTQKLLQNITALPPLPEQLRIISKVDELMALCDQLEQQHINSEEAHDKLVKVLLDSLVQSKDAEEFEDSWQRIANHFDTLFTTEDSVDQLKQILLQLAVMGKLVPQNHNDEPAKELLKRIQAEKIKLIKEGKLSKDKVLSLSNKTNAPFEIPNNWTWTKIGEITNFGKTEKADLINSNTWVLDLEDIEKDTSKLLQKLRFSERNSLSNKSCFQPGDLLYGKLRPYLNKVIIADENGVCTTEILPIRCYGPYSNSYFKIVLMSPYFINYVNEKSYGMKMPRLGTEDGRNAYFPLPPLEEQYLIADKVAELTTLCDELKSRIQQASAKQKKIADVLVSQGLH